MKTIRVAGVPEHFNLPWKNALNAHAFSDQGIDLQWTDVPEGTGRLAQMLQDNQVDLAVILTEGIVKAIHQGNPSRIVQKYVESPLLWGVHVAANSNLNEEVDLAGKKVAISRYGSGSELMAYVHADQFQWPNSSLKFEVVHTLDGAVEALTQGKADYFLWERFMTQPIVDRGIFRRIGVCPTPWPSFVIAATTDFLTTQPDTIQTILDVINTYTTAFKNQPQTSCEQIVAAFGQQPEQVNQWLDLTEWSQVNFSEQEINQVQQQLMQYGIIDAKIDQAKILG